MAHMAFQSTVGSSAPQQHSRIQVQLGEWWASRWRSSSHASSSHQWRPSLSGLGDCDCRISSVHSVCRGFINRALQGVTVNGFLLGSLFFCVILNAPRGAALQEETSMQSLVQFDKKIIYIHIFCIQSKKEQAFTCASLHARSKSLIPSHSQANQIHNLPDQGPELSFMHRLMHSSVRAWLCVTDGKLPLHSEFPGSRTTADGQNQWTA